MTRILLIVQKARDRKGSTMSNSELAKSILKDVGGQGNVTGVTHCVTRLRFTLNDEGVVDKAHLEATAGVIGIAENAGQFQVIIGPAVGEVYDEVTKLVGDVAKADAADAEKPAGSRKGVAGLAKEALDTLISCFTPAIPAMAGAGMVKVLAALLLAGGLVAADSTSYILLNSIGNAFFYFLPIFVAFNASKRMGVDTMLSMTLAAILMSPEILAAAAETGTTVGFFGLPLTILDYNAQALPIIFSVWLLKYVDKFADKVSPNVVKVFLRPMIDILVVAPIMLIVIGPAALVLGNFFMQLCAIMSTWGWIAVGINAFLFPLMVLTGTHNATIPLIVQMFAAQGFDPIFMPCGLAANMAEAGAAGAVALRTKNKALRSTALSATVSALLGITEPALYGVNLRLKKPFVGVLLGALLGGCYIGLIGLAAPTFVTPSVITAPIFVPEGVNLLLGLSCVPVCYLITFAITLLLGFEDVPETAVETTVPEGTSAAVAQESSAEAASAVAAQE